MSASTDGGSTKISTASGAAVADEPCALDVDVQHHVLAPLARPAPTRCSACRRGRRGPRPTPPTRRPGTMASNGRAVHEGVVDAVLFAALGLPGGRRHGEAEAVAALATSAWASVVLPVPLGAASTSGNVRDPEAERVIPRSPPARAGARSPP